VFSNESFLGPLAAFEMATPVESSLIFLYFRWILMSHVKFQSSSKSLPRHVIIADVKAVTGNCCCTPRPIVALQFSGLRTSVVVELRRVDTVRK
jgi:hypothetical protein